MATTTDTRSDKTSGEPTETRTDFLGQQYGVGDYVVYANLSGRSATMTFGQVAKLNASGTVGVWPIKNSRWKSYGRTWQIDTRTGEKIDIFEGLYDVREGNDPLLAGMPHVRKLQGFYRKSNDFYVPSSQVNNIGRDNCYYVGRNEFEPHVGKAHQEQIVTLKVTANIVKWNGEPPDEGDLS